MNAEKTFFHLITLAFLICATLTSSNLVKIQTESNGNPTISSELGKKIAEKSFTDLDGNTFKITDFKGKIVILDFWASWCSPCIVGFYGMEKVIEEHPGKVVVIAYSGFGEKNDKKIRKFVSKNSNRFEFIYTHDPALPQELGIKAIPFKIIYDTEGNLVESKTGTKSKEAEQEYLEGLIVNYFSDSE